jgi:hypothetical protein
VKGGAVEMEKKNKQTNIEHREAEFLPPSQEHAALDVEESADDRHEKRKINKHEAS